MKLLSVRREERSGGCLIMSSRSEKVIFWETVVTGVRWLCKTWSALYMILSNICLTANMIRGFQTWVMRRTEANPNAAMYQSFHLLVVFGYSETPPSWWGLLESSKHNSVIGRDTKIISFELIVTDLWPFEGFGGHLGYHLEKKLPRLRFW